jgi:hypothetical protein
MNEVAKKKIILFSSIGVFIVIVLCFLPREFIPIAIATGAAAYAFSVLFRKIRDL